jgi:hypothetical protein
MNDAKYIGMDVHTATISAAVRDSSGNLVMEATLETKAETILELVHGLRGSVRVSFEEGTCASWLHDLLKPHVSEVLVCDSRKNALLRVGNKNDREDARKLSELLFLNERVDSWELNASRGDRPSHPIKTKLGERRAPGKGRLMYIWRADQFDKDFR